MDGPEWFDDIGGKKISQFSIRFSTTSLQNLMSIIEATVSSLGRSSVGPKTTPRLAAVIKLVSCLAATRPRILGHKTSYKVSRFGLFKLVKYFQKKKLSVFISFYLFSNILNIFKSVQIFSDLFKSVQTFSIFFKSFQIFSNLLKSFQIFSNLCK